jgi:hypothetical protein
MPRNGVGSPQEKFGVGFHGASGGETEEFVERHGASPWLLRNQRADEIPWLGLLNAVVAVKSRWRS